MSAPIRPAAADPVQVQARLLELLVSDKERVAVVASRALGFAVPVPAYPGLGAAAFLRLSPFEARSAVAAVLAVLELQLEDEVVVS